MSFLGFLVFVLGCFILVVLAQDVTIVTQDPRMHFDGTWVVQDQGGHQFTTTIGSSVWLEFPGEFTFFVVTFYYAAIITIFPFIILWVLMKMYRNCCLLARDCQPPLWDRERLDR